MLVDVAHQVPTRRWKLATWLCGIFQLLALLMVTQRPTSSSEIVRFRKRLLVNATQPGDFERTPDTVPASCMLKRGTSDPYFFALAEWLKVPAESSDWGHGLAMIQHLPSHPELSGSQIQGDLRGSYLRVMERGHDCCSDFTRASMALSIAAGMPYHAKPFSFDICAGGHLHTKISGIIFGWREWKWTALPAGVTI